MTNKPKVELHLGDCLEFMRTMPDKSVDAIITDLPYGTTANSWDEVIPFSPMWEQVERINKGVFVTTASQPFTSRLVMSNLSGFKYEWIFEKHQGSNFMNAHRQPLKIHENILVFYSKQCLYNPQRRPSNKPIMKSKKQNSPVVSENYRTFDKIAFYEDDGLRMPISIIKFHDKERFITGNGSLNRHPTQKPVTLYEYLTRTYTNKGDTVLDITMGSGTTGVACVQTGRNFIGIEIDPTYFAIAEKRIAEAQLQERLDFDD